MGLPEISSTYQRYNELVEEFSSILSEKVYGCLIFSDCDVKVISSNLNIIRHYNIVFFVCGEIHNILLKDLYHQLIGFTNRIM